LVDAWLLVRDIEFNGERNRGMYVMKSRGMKHSNQVREFIITDNGLSLVDVYLGPDGVLTGSAREAEQLKEHTGQALHDYALNRKDREILRKRKVLESKISSLQTEFESVEEELNKVYMEEELRREIMEKTRHEITKLRREPIIENTDKPTKKTGKK
jgi:circadian clock protein KaiC